MQRTSHQHFNPYSSLFLISFTILIVQASTSEKILVLSDPATTTVIWPPDNQTALMRSYAVESPNFLGFGPQWIWLDGPDTYPANFKATFQTIFYSHCPQGDAQLIIRVDDYFTAYLNGRPIMSGSNKASSFKVGIHLLCG